MKPHEINALIAEHVLSGRLGNYCEDIKDAWLVVEELVLPSKPEISYTFDIRANSDRKTQDNYLAKFSYGGGAFVAAADTAPMAICLAALKSKEVDLSHPPA